MFCLKQAKSELKVIAAELVAVLDAKGFVVQRYDSYSTDSIYLKLDYGVCNSIRISDHSGKKKLKYRYNIEQSARRELVMDKGLPRHYYPYEDVNVLVVQILADREAKLKQYGAKSYAKFMAKNKEDNSEARGFWQQARLVSKSK